MSDPKSPKQPAWKRASGAPAPQKQPEKGWQGNAPAGNKPPVTAWGLPKWARVGGVLTALVGVAAGGWYFWAIKPLPTNKPQFVLLGAGYETNLAVPHNVAGMKGLRALKDAIGDPDRIDERPLKAGGKELADLFEPSFFSLRRKPKEVVIFVSAHGVARADGDRTIPCLVPDDHDPGKPEGLIDLDVLLKRLEKLPDSNKVLILDVAGVRGDWSLGQFHSTFLQALEKRESELAAIPNLVVIVSADKDEFSWVAPEWGTTIFAHHVIEGLQGATGKELLDVESLYEHVKKKVSDWTRHNRARSQRPRLIDPKQHARRVVVANHKGEVPFEPAAPEAVTANHKDGAATWEECQQLERRAPWLTDPVRWRKYQDCLVRAEELRHAGDLDHAQEVLKTARELKEIFEGVKGSAESSLGLTLTMPDVLGAQLGERAQKWLRGFAEVVKEGKYDEAVKLVDTLTKTGDTREQQLLRNRAAREFLRVAAADPKKVWETAKARELLGRLDDPTVPIAAEAHYLAMLKPDEKRGGPLQPLLRRKDEPKAWELVKKTLAVRLLAEEAAAGLSATDKDLPALSAEVLPWTREIVDKADGERRKGQDLLFTSEEAKAWPEAEKALDAAAESYRKAIDVAGKVRRARMARDRALAQLPYYTRWLARRPPSTALGEADEERLVKNSWRGLRDLDRRLNEKPGNADALPALTDEVRKSLDAVQKEYRDLVVREEQAATQQDKWHEIDALLRVPLTDLALSPGQRVQLLNKIDEIARKLHESTARAPEDAKGVENSVRQAKEEARRHARFAQETLRDRPDAPRDWSERLEDGLSLVGQWVAAQHLLLARDAQRELKSADEPAKDLQESIQSLGTSAALARRVEGWTHDKHLAEEPTRRHRNLLLHRFLCWQAGRTYLDHWAAADPASQDPYYRVAGLRFLNHAGSVLRADSPDRDPKKPDRRQEELLALDARLKSATAFEVQVSATGRENDYSNTSKELLISDEAFLPRWHRLRGPKDVGGQPVAWVDFAGGVQGPEAEQVRRVEAIDTAFPGRIEPKGELGKRPRRQGTHAVKGYFRGQERAIVTPVIVAGEPDLVVVRPPQNLESLISVQARRDVFERAVAQKAALAIVLDCSKSMVSNKLPGTNTPRWDAAKAALRKVMQEMPAGVQVSLRAFGSKDSPPVTENILNAAEHGKWAKNEVVWRTHRWNPNHLEERMRQVTNLVPDGATPLLRTMWLARNDFPEGFKGRRIMVVVTDGGDSNFYARKPEEDMDLPLKKSKGETLPDFLKRTFRGEKRYAGVEVHVIGFDIRQGVDDTEATLRAAAEMRKAVPAIGGQYHDVKDAAALARELTSALLTMEFVADADDSRPGHDRPRRRGNLSATDAGPGSLRWLKLPTRDYPEYTVRLPAIPGLTGKVNLQPGDRLALELVSGEGDALPKFRRMMYADSSFLKGYHNVKGRVTTKHDDETWVAAGLQNHLPRTGDPRLTLLTTLEQEHGAQQTDRYIQTVRPRWTWFEVHGPKGQAAEARVFPVGDFPAPAWGVEVADWPSRDDPVQLKAWWTGRSFTQLARRHSVEPGQTILDLKEKRWGDRPESEAITIESIRQEPVVLRVPAEGKEGLVQEAVRNCLVVRLRYPKDPTGSRPFFVQLGERDVTSGQAHRWFHQAGKYTGIFWPVTEEKARSIKELLLYSVPELKANAATATLDLGKPDHESRRPGIP